MCCFVSFKHFQLKYRGGKVIRGCCLSCDAYFFIFLQDRNNVNLLHVKRETVVLTRKKKEKKSEQRCF